MENLSEEMMDGDEVFIINVGGYIGSSTQSEIEYAMKAGKQVRYLEPLTHKELK